MVKSLKKLVESKNYNSACQGEVSLVTLDPQALDWNFKGLYPRNKVKVEIKHPFRNYSPVLNTMNIQGTRMVWKY